MNIAGWFSPSAQWYHALYTYEEAGADLDAFRQLVTKNPQGFLGRYGLGNKLIQERSYEHWDNESDRDGARSTP